MKTRKTKTGLMFAIIMLLTIGGFTPTMAITKDKKAENIFSSYVKAIGGEKAINSIENMVVRSELTFLESGVKIDREIIVDKANKYYCKASANRMGSFFKAYDGNTCWELYPTGLRLITGKEKTTFLNESVFLRHAKWEANLAEYQFLGQVTIDGIELLKISVTTIYGVNETWYFNKNDGLLARVEEQLEMPNETIKVANTFEDYRELNGVKLSFKQQIIMPGKTNKITCSSILLNQPLDNSIFAVPIDEK